LRQNVLAKIRLWTILVALGVAIVTWFAVSFDFGAGVFLTALWAAASFWSLEGLLRAAVVPPGAPRNEFAVILWIAAKLAVYAVAVWVLFSRPFPPSSHAIGFTILIVCLVGVGARHRAEEIRTATPDAADQPGPAQGPDADPAPGHKGAES
jgi:hypothetical protein